MRTNLKEDKNMYYVNGNIEHLYRTSDNMSRKGYLRLDMNENPEGLPKEFVTEVLSKITPEFLSTYPEKQPLTELLADYYSVNTDQIGLFNGSDEAIRLIFESFSKENGRVIATEPTFAMYQVYACMYGLQYTSIKYDTKFNLDFEAFIRAIDQKTNLIFALNPNNPIGSVFTESEMEQIIEKAYSYNAIVVIDEAYHYFYPNSFIDYLKKYNNVIILRTFSKLLSLASCRLGVAISNNKIISILKKSCCSYNVNSIALLFGEEIFSHRELITTLIETQLQGKKYLITEFEERGYEVRAYEGNFIFVKPKLPAQQIARKLLDRKVLVKSYPDSFLKDYIRISTGSYEVMKKFITIFIDLDKI